ncbi:MAG: hypothetical protein AB1416_07170 [Actinomycetota bacterium]
MPIGLIALAAAVAVPPAAAVAAEPAAGAGTAQPAKASPFTADRASSLPLGLTPDDVATPLRYPDEPVVLAWSAVPGASSYKVEVASNPGFTDVVWSKDTDQTQIAPEVLLPDGSYWWRVTATDEAGTVGLTSSAARFAKTWPSRITGLKTSAAPGGPSVTQVDVQPYLSWTALPGATEYDVQIASGDQFATPVFNASHAHAAFLTPGVFTVLPDDSYQWRVRARDPKANPGPWSQPVAFTKAWYQAQPTAPADGAATSNVYLRWSPVAGAEKYEVQITSQQHTWTGTPLKISAETTNTAYVPTFQDEKAKGLLYGQIWWRVRPVVNGTYGGWSAPRLINYQAPTSTTAVAQLTPATDSDSALTPQLEWTPVTGAAMYRVDIATDPLFHNIVESAITTNQAWASRTPLPDNQVSTGYYWRVVWGSGTVLENPAWMVDEATVPTDDFKKQTSIVLGSGATGELTQPPLLSWSAVSGAPKYELELSQNPLFEVSSLGGAEVDRVKLYALGVMPGTHMPNAKHLGDGTWHWRVRAVDGGDAGQTWSPVGKFTLTSPRPAASTPADGDTVVGAPLMRWSAVAQACGYEVQVGDTPTLTDAATKVATAQTALVLTAKDITKTGPWYWRVRADFCDEQKGQWSPTRSFTSVRPPDFGLNEVPAKVEYGGRTTVVGALSFGGARVKKPTLVLERRVWPEREYRFFGTVKGDAAGRFAFRIKNTRTAAYRLRWAADDTHPEGQAPFAIQVLPRVAFTVGGRKVVRRGKVMVRGSVFPARTALIQTKVSGGWETIRTLKLRRTRFAFPLKATLVPGRHTLRMVVPGDQSLSTARSRQHPLFVYDKFVIRGGRGR